MCVPETRLSERIFFFSFAFFENGIFMSFDVTDQKSPIWVIYEALIIYLQFVMGFEVAVPCVLFTENVW